MCGRYSRPNEEDLRSWPAHQECSTIRGVAIYSIKLPENENKQLVNEAALHHLLFNTHQLSVHFFQNRRGAVISPEGFFS